jgi:hypothetical protein
MICWQSLIKRRREKTEMLQWIVKKLDPQKSEEFLKKREEKYPKKIRD